MWRSFFCIISQRWCEGTPLSCVWLYHDPSWQPVRIARDQIRTTHHVHLLRIPRRESQINATLVGSMCRS